MSPISIHALLAESDSRAANCQHLSHQISIHALLAESDKPTSRILRFNPLFLSTLSLRRATNSANANLSCHRHFYPRSPCGERPYQPNAKRENQSISIHALLAESDMMQLSIVCVSCAFLSTLSLRRATSSIDDLEPSTTHFYPRSPCGERPTCRILRAKLRPISIHALLAESDYRIKAK